jgi:hypothetical protein
MTNDFLIFLDVTDYHCHVCFGEVSGAHKCITCRRSVHVICGVALGNEGYGQAVKCYKCHETGKILVMSISSRSF